MTETQTHMSVPWTTENIERETGIWSSDLYAGYRIATVHDACPERDDSISSVNAQFIIAACNNHETMLEALREALPFVHDASWWVTKAQDIIKRIEEG